MWTRDIDQRHLLERFSKNIIFPTRLPPTSDQLQTLELLTCQDCLKTNSVDSAYFFEWRFDLYLLHYALAQGNMHSLHLDLEQLTQALPKPLNTAKTLLTLRTHKEPWAREIVYQQVRSTSTNLISSKARALLEPACRLLETPSFRSSFFTLAISRGWSLIDAELDLDGAMLDTFPLIASPAVESTSPSHHFVSSLHYRIQGNCVDKDRAELAPRLAKWCSGKQSHFLKLCFVLDPLQSVRQSQELLRICLKLIPHPLRKRVALIFASPVLSQLRSEWGPIAGGFANITFLEARGFSDFLSDEPEVLAKESLLQGWAGSLAANSATAPTLGQISLAEYRLLTRQCSERKRFALISQSTERSPGLYLHNLFMQSFLPSYRYLSLAISPNDSSLFFETIELMTLSLPQEKKSLCLETTREDIRRRICVKGGKHDGQYKESRARQGECDNNFFDLFSGFSVSSPYKSTLYKCLLPLFQKNSPSVSLSQAARVSGACNTLVRLPAQSGVLASWHADNTDVRALQIFLSQFSLSKDAAILILGSGDCALAFMRALTFWGFTKLAMCSRCKPVSELDHGIALEYQFFLWHPVGDQRKKQVQLEIEKFLSGSSGLLSAAAPKQKQTLVIQASGVESGGANQKRGSLLQQYPFDISWYHQQAIGYWLELNNTQYPRIAVSEFVLSAGGGKYGVTAQEFFALQGALQLALWFSDDEESLFSCSSDHTKLLVDLLHRKLSEGWFLKEKNLGLVSQFELFCYLFFILQFKRGACGKYLR